jgi:hypothetical protein
MEYKSLFDYLGKPAGKELGLQIKKLADANGIQTMTKIVTNKNYSGNIRMYPVHWLNKVFSPKTIGNHISITYLD